MKTLGLIGGTTWFSTIDYYRYINQMVAERFGGMHSAKILLYSLNFDELKTLFYENDWVQVGEILSGIAKNLENAGAEAIVLCSNTTHIPAESVARQINIPLIHIADATAGEILKMNLKKVALLGTKFTMDSDYYERKLAQNEIELLIPEREEREFINTTIFNELGKNIFSAETKQSYLEIIQNLGTRGAEGVIFGCTEIPLLLRPEDCPLPSFDTTLIHARAAVEFALAV